MSTGDSLKLLLCFTMYNAIVAVVERKCVVTTLWRNLNGIGGLTMTEYIEREAAEKVASRYGCTNGVVIGRHSGLADCIAFEIAKLPND